MKTRAILLAAVLTAPSWSLAGPADLDPNFGQGGIVDAPIGDVRAYASGAVLQDDGAIMVFGYAYTSPKISLVLARFAPNGMRDVSFGTDGVAELAIEDKDVFAQTIAIQPDGKYVVAGAVTRDTAKMFIARFTADGLLDAGFGNAGIVITPLQFNSIINDVAILQDGKILAAGSSYLYQGMVVRYLPDGSLDQPFGTAGYLQSPLSGISHMRIFDGGDVLLAGDAAMPNSDTALAAVRMHPDGTFDSEFGVAGEAVIDIGEPSTVSALALQSDDKFVIGINTTQVSGDSFLLARFDEFGVADDTFGTHGLATMHTGSFAETHSIAAAPQKLLVAGRVINETDFGAALLRCNSDGSPDAGFGTGGIVSSHSMSDEAVSVLLQPDEKIVTVGSTWVGEQTQIQLRRYTGDGPVIFANGFDH